jgi:hypothetical protein
MNGLAADSNPEFLTLSVLTDYGDIQQVLLV